MVLGFFRHLGSFLFLAACVLLIITTITAPVNKNLAILRVNLQDGSTVNFGTFGYCILRYVSLFPFRIPFLKTLHTNLSSLQSLTTPQ